MAGKSDPSNPFLAEDDDDESGNSVFNVGYGKPPRHSQFKPGQSGNPKGRPRKRKPATPMESIQQQFLKMATFRLRGQNKAIRMRPIDALLATTLASGIKGDHKFAAIAFKLARELGVFHVLLESPKLDFGRLTREEKEKVCESFDLIRKVRVK